MSTIDYDYIGFGPSYDNIESELQKILNSENNNYLSESQITIFNIIVEMKKHITELENKVKLLEKKN